MKIVKNKQEQLLYIFLCLNLFILVLSWANEKMLMKRIKNKFIMIVDDHSNNI